MVRTAVTIEQLGKEIVNFLSNFIQVEKLILFGSYAYGNPRKDSDFDIAVVSEDLSGKSILERMQLFSKAALTVDSRVELRGFSRKEFRSPDKGSMLELIKKDGKVIYTN